MRWVVLLLLLLGCTSGPVDEESVSSPEGFSFTLDVSVPSSVELDEPFDIGVNVTNAGEYDLIVGDVKLLGLDFSELSLPSEDELTQAIYEFAVGDTETFVFEGLQVVDTYDGGASMPFTVELCHQYDPKKDYHCIREEHEFSIEFYGDLEVN